ncbi:ribonuclease H-like domain-containing protein [Tanacetum coccineum]
MSEAEPIPHTSSVTALRIPMIKKGEYDLWSMKMRQYIAITDHILWDIITNGDQTTTDPASSSVSAPKTSLAANARRNNKKALNILLSAIPDRHLLSFHDAEDAKTLWSVIKARFGGNEASKKMQKNLLKQQFETFTIGSREELDSAYERFQNILIATMIRGQPGLDELEFDDLYNNLKVYEHELKGVSNSSSQNIAFLSTEVKGSTLKQSTADPANIPKGYTQAASSKVHTASNYASHSDEIICSFFSQQASMPTTHDDEDLLQIDEDAMEEIDIRWQVAMITARIRKFMRKTGRPIDLKPKNGITFDKSKIECFNCQKLGHFARECRFAKYQENRANGRQEKRIVAIEDSNSKALVATDNNEDIDWTKEFDAEPVTFAMMALTEVEQDDWSMEFDAEHVHFGQDGLGDFDWSYKADDTPVSLALMATNSEVPYCSKCSKSYKKLLENYQTERDNFQKARSEILGYQMSLESLEVILKTHEKNEYAWGDKYEQMEYDLKIRDLKLEEKQKELDQALKERDDFKVKLEKWTNASVLQNEVLNKQRYLSDKSCIGFGIESSSSMDSDNSSGNTNSTESLYPNFQKAKGFHLVPPPTENTKSSQPEIDRNKVMIEDWVDSDDEETVLNSSEIQKEIVLNSENSETSFENKSPSSQNSVGQGSRKTGLGHKWGAIQMKISRIMILLTVDCSGSMTGDKDKLSDFKAFKGGYVAFGNDPKGGRITGKGTIKTSFIDFEKVSYVEELKFNLLSVSQICDKKHNVLFTDKECLILSPKFKFVDEDLVILRAPRKNDVYSLDLKNIIPSGGDETYDMLHDLIVGLEKWLSIKVKTSGVTMETEFKNQFMNEFCAMKGIKREYSIARTLSKVTRKVQDCLHVDFLENQENQKGKGPDWMFDLDLLTSSMNYITVKKENYADSGSKGSTYDDIEDQDDQQFIVHVPSINAAQNTHSEERTANKDVPLSYEEQALHDELGKESVNSTLTLSTANTPSQSTGNTPTDSDDDVPKDGVFSTNSFDDENTDNEEDEAPDYNNMDHTIDVLLGYYQEESLRCDSVQHQALLSFIYKQNRTNHKDQQTCLFACFLSQEEPKKVSQALADESWVEAMQEELLQFKLQDVWVLCDLPDGKRVIGTKWVFRNKRDERGTIIKNKA